MRPRASLHVVIVIVSFAGMSGPTPPKTSRDLGAGRGERSCATRRVTRAWSGQPGKPASTWTCIVEPRSTTAATVPRKR